MSYIVGLREQTANFLLSLGFGFSIGLVYDLVRIIRRLFSDGKKAIMTADILYAVFAAIMTFVFLLTATNGKIMVYILFGELLGFFIYYFTFGVFAMRVGDKLTAFLKKFLKKASHAVFAPFRWAFEHIVKKIRKISQKSRKKAQKAAKKSKFHLKVCNNLLYNLNVKYSVSAKKRKDVKRDDTG